MVHGISAAVGKLGALSADIIMGQVRAVCAVQMPLVCCLSGCKQGQQAFSLPQTCKLEQNLFMP